MASLQTDTGVMLQLMQLKQRAGVNVDVLIHWVSQVGWRA